MTTTIAEPETAALLTELTSVEGPGFDDMTIGEKRAGLAAMLLEAEADAPRVTQTDIQVPVRGGRAIDGVVMHPGGDQPLPVLFLMQGGGWSLSGSTPYRPLAALLAKELRRLVIMVDFRLAPEHKFPAGLEDCLDTYQWLLGEAAALGGDTGRIALFGDSAGGNLAVSVALSAHDMALQMPEALVLAYPMIDVRKDAVERYPSRMQFGGGEFFLTEDSIEAAVAYYLAEEGQRNHPLISLLEHESLAALPKTIIVLPELDPLRDEGEAFAGKLAALGVPVSSRVFSGTIHAFLSLFHRIGRAHEAVATIKSLL